MRRVSRLCIILFLFVSIISACTPAQEPLQNSTDQNSLDSQTPSEPSEPVIEQPVIPEQFVQLPQSLVLAPGADFPLQVPHAHYISSDESMVSVDVEGKLHVAEQAITGKKATVKVSVYDQSKEVEIKVKYSLLDTITDMDGIATITNFTDPLVLVNKERVLPSDYIPEDLVEPNVPFSFKGESEKKHLRKEAATALEQLFAQAESEGIHLLGVSGYRSYATQKSIFNNNVKEKGLEATSQYSAQPGQSEHQTGLTIDVFNGDIYKDGLVDSFGDSPEGKWLAEHVADFGFIIRYPKGKEKITGYNYEPWHIRYVGVDVAKEIMSQNLTLEEYFEIDPPVQQ